MRSLCKDQSYQRAVQIGLVALRLLHSDESGLRVYENRIASEILNSLIRKMQRDHLAWIRGIGPSSGLYSAVVSGHVVRGTELVASDDTEDEDGHGGSKAEKDVAQSLVLSDFGADSIRRITSLRRLPRAGEVTCDARSLSVVEEAAFEIIRKTALNDMLSSDVFFAAVMKFFVGISRPSLALAAFEQSLCSTEPPSTSMVQALALASSACGVSLPVKMAASSLVLPAVRTFSELDSHGRGDSDSEADVERPAATHL